MIFKSDSKEKSLTAMAKRINAKDLTVDFIGMCQYSRPWLFGFNMPNLQLFCSNLVKKI